MLVLRQVGPKRAPGMPEWDAAPIPSRLLKLDVPSRRLNLRVSNEELAKRRAAWKPRARKCERGYSRLFLDHVLQANEGCDFDFLRGKTPVRPEDTAGPSHA